MAEAGWAGPLVWAFLVERGLDGAELRLFWNRADAHAAVREYLAEDSAGDGIPPADVDEVIEQYNQLSGNTEHVFVGPLPIEGARCVIYGEPMSLAEEADSESWVHTEDANDGGDHTAEYSCGKLRPGAS
ncbi:MAG: hypothetical protein GY708_21525 [Actinomycetia bacterium]|nr:hypothetical protein [Actinomycetes bacterium]